MIIFPAIDLKNGKCVRLYQGEMDRATIFNDSPQNQALQFAREGFSFLHLVDLDGAIEGSSVNEKSVREILQAVKIPVQLGGGIRDMRAIEKWLELGVSRVILGTVAAKNPDFVREACKKFPQKIVVGIDSKNGFVATEGWTSATTTSTLDLAQKFEDKGVAAIIYTDISRDGTLGGVDIAGTKALVDALKIPVIASGGVANIDDVNEVAKLGAAGVVVGRALYEKKISVEDLRRFF